MGAGRGRGGVNREGERETGAQDLTVAMRRKPAAHAWWDTARLEQENMPVALASQCARATLCNSLLQELSVALTSCTGLPIGINAVAVLQHEDPIR